MQVARKPQNNRRWVKPAVAAVVLVLLGLAVAGLVRSRSGTGSSGSSTSSTGVGGVPSSAGVGYRYIWTGAPGRGFTPAEIQDLARHYQIVILSKTTGRNFADVDQAVHEIKQANPHVVVLLNLLASKVNTGLLQRFGAGFQQSWMVRSPSGRTIGQPGRGYFVQTWNPAYRAFILHQLAIRMAAAPYDGVMFDNVRWYSGMADLTADQQQKLNQGTALLLSAAKRQLGSKLVLYNGIARGNSLDSPRLSRGFQFLPVTDGAQDEFNCYLDSSGAFRPASQLTADASRYAALAQSGKTILLSVKLRGSASQADADHIKRFCFANGLMSYVPGKLYIQFKEYTSEAAGPQIANGTSAEQSLPLGDPVAPARVSGDTASRLFRNGWVVVNRSPSPVTVTLPLELRLANGGSLGATYRRGAHYVVPGDDAAFFLKP